LMNSTQNYSDVLSKSFTPVSNWQTSKNQQPVAKGIEQFTGIGYL